MLFTLYDCVRMCFQRTKILKLKKCSCDNYNYIQNDFTFKLLLFDSQVMKDIRLREEEPPKPLRFLQKIEKPVPRPPTPTVQVPSEVIRTVPNY